MAKLPTEDADFLREMTTPPWQLRAARQAARDASVREALEAHASLCPRPAAEALAAELRRAAACPNAIGDRAALLRRVLHLSGRPLAWRRIFDIGAATFVQKKLSTLHKDTATSAI